MLLATEYCKVCSKIGPASNSEKTRRKFSRRSESIESRSKVGRVASLTVITEVTRMETAKASHSGTRLTRNCFIETGRTANCCFRMIGYDINFNLYFRRIYFFHLATIYAAIYGTITYVSILPSFFNMQRLDLHVGVTSEKFLN